MGVQRSGWEAGSGGPRARRPLRWSVVAAVAVLVTACSPNDGMFTPQSAESGRLADVFYISFWTSIVVIAIVLGLMLFALVRRRDGESRLPGNKFVALGGLVFPGVVLMAMMAVTFGYLAQIPQRGELTIEVTGHQFWWEIYYPEHDAVTANEIHIPTGTRVEVRLLTEDVIHSFWVPELGPKGDNVPGRVGSVIIRSDEEGVFRGQCYEYCGLQHANMAFVVVAERPEEFEAWVRNEARPAAVRDPEAEEIFMGSCAGCHTILGTAAEGELGPDLTHLASRRTLGAATIPNDRGHLSGWITNSQSVKPGNEMPPITTLEPDELQRLLDYLEQLE